MILLDMDTIQMTGGLRIGEEVFRVGRKIVLRLHLNFLHATDKVKVSNTTIVKA